jgi:hypothetical protein
MAASNSSGSSYYSSANSAYPSWGNSLNYNNNNSSSNGGNNMLIGPEMVVGGVGALAKGVGDAFAANTAARSAQNIARMNLEAAAQGAFENRLFGQWAGTGKELFAQGLQRDAANYQQAFLDPRKSILNAENIGRTYAGELSPFAQKLRQQEKSGGIDTLLAGKFMPMFDSPNKPFSYGRAPGYTTGSLV